MFGSTYTGDELLTALYLENRRLREKLGTQPTINYITPVSPSEAKSADDYARARQYLETNPNQGYRVRHLVIVNNEYPDYGAEYANGFVHRRVKEYQASGIGVDVIVYGKRARRVIRVFDGVSIISGYVHELSGLLALRQYDSISAHFLRPDMWAVLEPYLAIHETPLHVFMHGYESDRWIRRAWELNDPAVLESMIDRTFELQRFWKHVVENRVSPSTFIFVSAFWRKAVEEDMDVVFPDNKVEIVHNVIDTELFQYQPKAADDRFKLLWVRSASSRKYGADIAVEVMNAALDSEYAEQVEITVIGDGKHFYLFEDAFGRDPRVKVERRFASQAEMASLHRHHGIFIVPSRLDSQGVSRDEAMASGLVPVTNAVTAIPEFVDPSCAILGEANRGDQLADKLLKLFDDPEHFLSMSKAASERARSQSGPEVTVVKELEIIRGIQKGNA